MKSVIDDLPRKSMVTVSSAFMSSRRERIKSKVLFACFGDLAGETFAGCDFATLDFKIETGFADFGAALLAFDGGFFDFADFVDDFFVNADFADVDPEVDLDLVGDLALDFDNADLARDHSFHCIADDESDHPINILRMWC